MRNGNRGDRKKARLKHLLDKWTMEEYLGQTEKVLGASLTRSRLGPGAIVYPYANLPHSHIGAYPQKQKGLLLSWGSFARGTDYTRADVSHRRSRG